MTVEILERLSLVFYILAGIMLITAVILFFMLKINIIIRELTGVDARRTIENYQKQNESGIGIDLANKNNQPVLNHNSSGKKSKKQRKLPGITDTFNVGFETAKIGTTKFQSKSDETTVLNDSFSEETTVLKSTQETTVLNNGSTETTVLENNLMESISITDNEIPQNQGNNVENDIKILFEITYMSTNEWIE